MKHKTPRKPASERQLAANRANAAKSTGPRTPEGKATSSQNAVTHGILQVNPVLTTEEEAEYNVFNQVFFKTYSPRNDAELQMCSDLIQIQWSQRRYRTMEHCQLELAMCKEGITDGYNNVRGVALATLAHQYLADHSTALQLLNRQLSRLNREYHQLIALYLEIHGPLGPSECEVVVVQNEPNPETDHDTSEQTPPPIPPNPEPMSALFRKAPAQTLYLAVNNTAPASAPRHSSLVTRHPPELTTDN